jgi:hypothetical protein
LNTLNVFGSAAYPALSRLYIEPNTPGTLALNLPFDAQLNGNVYIANGEFNSASPTEVFGAIETTEFNSANDITIHYDRQVLHVADWCQRPTSSGCSSCGDCNNQACINGQCSVCTEDSQCCAPLVCSQGRCVDVPG